MLIKLILSLAFAEKEALGWDSQVKSWYANNERQFDFKIAREHYKTSSSMVFENFKAEGIYTKGTRIYQAFKAKDKKKKLLIIKDYWPSDKYETEDVIQRMILEDIQDPTERDMFKNLTLTPIASGNPRLLKESLHADMQALRCFGFDVAEEESRGKEELPIGTDRIPTVTSFLEPCGMMLRMACTYLNLHDQANAVPWLRAALWRRSPVTSSP